MNSYLEGMTGALVTAAVFCGIFAVSMMIDRSRYRNIIFLDFALFSLMGVIVSLFGSHADAALAVLTIVFLLGVLILPFFLILNGFTMLRREGRSLANMLSLILGIVIFAGEAATFLWMFTAGLGTSTPFLYSISKVFPLLVLLSVSVIYLSVVFLSFLIYSVFLQFIPHRRDFDYVIIHGAGIRKDGTVTKLLAGRCDKAIEIYRKDKTPPFLIPSGGQGSDEVTSEADAMSRYLTENGIPEEKIIREDRSTTTMENLKNCKEIIDKRPGRHYTALVTSNYHVYRAMRYARKIGLKSVGIGAHVAAYYWPSALIREFAAVHREKKHLVLFLLGYAVIILPVILVVFFGL